LDHAMLLNLKQELPQLLLREEPASLFNGQETTMQEDSFD